MRFKLLFLAFWVVTSSWAASPLEALQAFQAKLQAKAGENEADPGYRRTVLPQVQALQSALARGDFERAQQALASTRDYNPPPELQSEWQKLADELAEWIVKMRQQAVIDWKKSVDEAASFAREAAVNAKTSADLDEALVRIASLQMKRTSSNNVLSQRANQKIEGTAKALDQLCRFFDYQAAGNLAAANSILQELSNSTGGYPLLAKDDLQKLMTEAPFAPKNQQEAVRAAFADVKKESDLPAALERMEKINKSPAYRAQGNSEWNLRPVFALVQASQALEAGNLEDATIALKEVAGGDTVIINTPNLSPLRDQIRGQLIIARIAKITGSPADSKKSAAETLTATLETLQAKEQYGKMAQLMAAISSIPGLRNADGLPWTPADERAAAAYAGGVQLETAGDFLAAINEYRRVITGGQSGRFAPTEPAQAALKRLQEGHPEAFQDVNGVVIEELRQIREDLRRMPTQRPYPY